MTGLLVRGIQRIPLYPYKNYVMMCLYESSMTPLSVRSVGWKLVPNNPDNKVHGANMGPTWVLSAPDGPHVGPVNLASMGINGTCSILANEIPRMMHLFIKSLTHCLISFKIVPLVILLVMIQHQYRIWSGAKQVITPNYSYFFRRDMSINL